MTAERGARGGPRRGHVEDGPARQVMWSVLSLAATIGLVVGVPAVLVLAVGWPLPTEVPSWEQFTEALEQQGITADVLQKALAVVVWLAWFPLAWAIGVEMIATARGRAARRVHAWPGAQYLARKLVASATLLLSSFGTIRHAGATPLDPLVIAGAETPGDEAFSGEEALVDENQVIDLGAVEPGDGVWSNYSDGDRQPAMAPAGRQPGATVSGAEERPAGDQQAASSPTGFGTAPDGVTVTSRRAPEPEVVHEVEHGDTFWGLAEEYLGSGLRWREIRDYNVGRTVAPGHVLVTGEDNLQVGWHILVPLEGEADAGSSSASVVDRPTTAEPSQARMPSAPAPDAGEDVDSQAEVDFQIVVDDSQAAGADGAGDAELAATTSDASPPVAPAPAVSGEPEVVHEVEPGDSFWSLAEDYLGDGSRWAEIRDHNVGRTVGAGRVLQEGEVRLEVGWRLELPPGAVSGGADEGDAAAPEDAAASDGADEDAAPPAVPIEVTMQPGDHFWSIAERQLEEAWGRPVTAEEIAPYWQQLVTENLDRLGSGDPDLLYPGEQFTAPAAPAPPSGEGEPPASPPTEEQAEPDTGSTDVPEQSTEDAGEAAPGGETPAEDPAGEQPTEEQAEPDTGSTDVPEQPTEDVEAAPPTTAPSQADNGTTAPDDASDDVTAEVEESLADAVDDDEADEEDESSGIPLIVPLGASAALAGMLLLALGRRRFSRRRQLRPGQVVQPRSAEDAELEREFALGARDVHSTVEAASRGYGAVLAGNPDLPPVTGLLISPARDVVLHLAEPAVPEIPFERGPASTQWELYLDELDLDPEFGPGPDPSASVLDTPTVIGRTDEGDWAVVDLESLGALEIDGDETVASDLVRSIVAELAMAPQAERMVDITVVGVEGLSPDVLEQGVVSFNRLDEDLVRRVERVAAETDSMQPHRGATARAQGMPRDGLFVMVVALGGTATPDPVLLERLTAAATPGGRGIAVVAVGPLGPGATRVLVDETGDAHIPHMGVTVDAVQLSAENLRRVERLLDNEPEVFPPPEAESIPESWPEWPDEWSSELAREAPGGWMGAWLPTDDDYIIEDEPLPSDAFPSDEAAPSDEVLADEVVEDVAYDLPLVDEAGLPEEVWHVDAEGRIEAEPEDGLSAAEVAAPSDAPPAEAEAEADHVEPVDGVSVGLRDEAQPEVEPVDGVSVGLRDEAQPEVEPVDGVSVGLRDEAQPEVEPADEEAVPEAEEGAELDESAPGEPEPPASEEEATQGAGEGFVDVDKLEADDLDDILPGIRLPEGQGTVDAAPPLAPVPSLPDVELPPVDSPDGPAAPEPLNLREEPRWPDPRTRTAAGGPPDVPGSVEEQEEGAAQWVPTYSPPPWELCVRIFADHVVETADGEWVSFRYGENPNVPNKNTHRGPELLSYLALSGRAATAEEVQDHMWWDRPIALSTVNKLVYGTRKVLGGAELLSHAQEDPLGRYRLAPTITTDAQLLAHGLEHAQMVANHSPEAAVEVLRPHLAGIESVAFRSGNLGQGLMEWGAAYRVIDAVELPVIEAALLFARLACERGRAGYFDALWGVDQGLRACPYNEALVRVAMEIEALLGNSDAVNHRYLSLATKLARDELEPEPETSELRARLGGTSRLRSAG